MARRLEVKDIPELPGYLTVAAVSERYGIHKGTVFYMIYNSRRFENVYKVSKGKTNGTEDQRPLLLLLEEEVKTVMADRGLTEQAGPNSTLAAWNRRVKDWARSIGWTQTPIEVKGPPQRALVAEYLKANPDDIKPGS